MEVSCQLYAPAALPPRKEPLVPIGQEVGWAPKPFYYKVISPGEGRENLERNNEIKLADSRQVFEVDAYGSRLRYDDTVSEFIEEHVRHREVAATIERPAIRNSCNNEQTWVQPS